MKKHQYLIVSILILIASLLVMLIPSWYFSMQQPPQQIPSFIASPVQPKRLTLIPTDKISLPVVEKRIETRAQPTMDSQKQITGTNQQRLKQAKLAASGWFIRLSRANALQQASIIKTLHAQQWDAVTLKMNNGQSTLFIGPFITKHDADQVAAKLPGLGIMSAKVEPFMPINMP